MSNKSRRFCLIVLFLLATGFGLFSPFAANAQGTTPGFKRDRSITESLGGDFETVNPYTGKLDFGLPLISTGGRGSAQTTLSLAIESQWEIYATSERVIVGQNDAYATFYHPYLSSIWRGYTMGPGRVFMQGGVVAGGSVIKFIFATQEGKQIELIDALTLANPGRLNCIEQYGRSWCPLGKDFISTDGSGITFRSDTDIYKGDSPDNPDEGYPNPLPTGYLLFPDGSRMRVEQGAITALTDVNGNKTTYEYEGFAPNEYGPHQPQQYAPPQQPSDYGIPYPYLRLVKIVDPLNREIRIQYNVDDPAPYGRCNKIIYKGFGGEDKTIRIAYRKLVADNLLKDGLQPKTLRQLFPLDQSPLFYKEGYPNSGGFTQGVLVVDDEIPEFYLPATVWLADGQSAYKFRYDNYGSLSRLELPTGAAIEYDWSAAIRNYHQNVGINDVTVTNNGSGDVHILRRVVERRLYKDNSSLVSKTNYSRPAYCSAFNPQNYQCQESNYYFPSNSEDFVAVDQKSSTNALQSRQRHYYYGTGFSFGYSQILGYDNWHNGKEYKTEYFADDGVTLTKRDLIGFKNKIVPWLSDQNNAPPYDTRPVEQISTSFENGKALAILKRTEYDEAGSSDLGYFSHLNVKRAKTYNYKVLDLNTAQNGTIETTASMYSESDLVSLSENDYVYNSGYKDRHLLGLVNEVRAMNPANPAQFLTKSQNSYDEQSQYYSMADYGSTVGYEAPTGSYAYLRGNATSSRAWFADENRWIETHTQYDNFGNKRKIWDSSGDPNRFVETEYSSQYYYAFPTKTITKAPDPTGIHGSNQNSTVSTAYDFWTDRATSITDNDGQITSIEYDALARPKKMFPPTGGSIIEREYGDTPDNLFIKTRTQINAQNWAEATTFFDNLGRVYKTKTKDSQGDIFSEIEYDNFGRVERTSNPYRQGDQKYWSKLRYDSTGRVVETYAPAPNGQTGASLGTIEFGISTLPGLVGNYVTATDASGKKARSFTNIYDQITRVDEPTGNNDLGALEDPNQPSYYTYNVKGELLKILQGNQNQNCQTAQCRFFMYDSLGRLTRVKQPEQIPNANLATTGNPENNQWTAGFTYDDFDNVRTVTDANATTITNIYDKAGRVTNINHSGGVTLPTEYFYDGTGLGLPQAPQFASGNLTKISNGVSETKLTSFDNYNRVLTSQQITDGQTYNFGYKYDSVGNLTEETYPSGRVVKIHADADGGLAAVSSKVANGVYKTYASNFSYTASGNVKEMMLGNGRWETAIFNEQGQMTQAGLGNTANDTSLWRINYDYGELNGDGSVNAGKNTGLIAKQTITLPTTAFVQTYKYDGLSRLVEAKENANSVSGAENWKQTFDYDRYGNRTSFYQRIGNSVLPIDNKTKPQIDPQTNRFTTGQGYTYDFNGNLMQDAENHKFTYDGDDRQTTVRDLNISTTPQNPDANVIGRYFYDGEGKRVKKITNLETTVFVYDAGGTLAAEYSTQSNSVPTTNYLTIDSLGSPRVVTDKQGNVVSRRDFMPFGEELTAGVGARDTNDLKYSAAGIDSVRQRFTGYEKDIEADLDFAEARMYKNRHGRFTAPDPLIASARLDDPQTFNRYTYTGNNPVNLTDPNGLDWCDNQSGNIAFRPGRCQTNEKKVETNRDKVVISGSFSTTGGYDAKPGDIIRFNDNGTTTLVSIHSEEQSGVEIQNEQSEQTVDTTSSTIGTVIFSRSPESIDCVPAYQCAGLRNISSMSPEEADRAGDIVDIAATVCGLAYDPCDVASGAIDAANGDYTGAELSAASAIPLAGIPVGVTKIAKKLKKIATVVNGNSKASKKAQHVYEVVETAVNKVRKTGISGGKIRKVDNKSYRAEKQVRKANNAAGFNKYSSRVIKKIPAGPGARTKALAAEVKNANKNRKNLDPTMHKRP